MNPSSIVRHHGVLDHPGRALDQPVAADEAVLVVVRLEVVEVDVQDREGAVLAHLALDLLLDADVPRQARERREVAHLLRAPERPLHAGEELDRVEGLDDVVVRAGLQSRDLVRGERFRGEHDDARVRGLRILPEALCHLEAVEPRHHHVEEHEVGTDLRRSLERLLAVASDGDLVARRAEVHLHEPRDVRIVVDDEDRLRHQSAPPATSGRSGDPASLPRAIAASVRAASTVSGA